MPCRTQTIALALILSLLGGGCSSTPATPNAAVTAADAAQPTAPAAADGKYYLNDGPPERSGIALADIPDAAVRLEKINPRHNRPYVVLNKRYVPFQRLQPYKKRGIASWYGKRYHGRKTASGEVYDMFAMTAAHPILPIPSYARVTHAGSGKSVVVRINDRGPFLQGREIDLSYAAAAKLGIVNSGTGAVTVEAIIPAQAQGGANANAAADERITAIAPTSDAVYIQLAAFAAAEAAQQLAASLQKQLPAEFSDKTTTHQKVGGLYAVQIGPYATHEEAVQADKRLCAQYQHCGFLTKRY